MTLAYRLVGYDRKTELASAEYDIPASKAKLARRIAGIDAEQVADCRLDAEQARAIARAIGARADIDHLDFFLEPYAVAAVHA